MTDKFMINCSNCGDEYTVWNFTGTAQPPKQCNKCDSTKIIVTSSEDSEQKKKQKLTSQQKGDLELVLSFQQSALIANQNLE